MESGLKDTVVAYISVEGSSDSYIENSQKRNEITIEISPSFAWSNNSCYLA